MNSAMLNSRCAPFLNDSEGSVAAIAAGRDYFDGVVEFLHDSVVHWARCPNGSSARPKRALFSVDAAVGKRASWSELFSSPVAMFRRRSSRRSSRQVIQNHG